MEKFPSSGNISSPCLTLSEAAAQLRLISESIHIHPIVKALGNDAKTCIVGGTVRDVLTNKGECDYDLASALPPTETKTRLEAAKIKVFDAGIKHGTVTAVIDGRNIEITTFRVPGKRESSAYSDSIENDLAGRDFTINALAYKISENEIVDPYNGANDLEAGVVRAVGNAEIRFIEDPQRILRAIRFGPAHGRIIEEGTASAAVKLADSVRSVSIERVRMELEKILVSPFAGAGIRMMRTLMLIEAIIPELTASYDFEQNRFHTEDVFEHTLTVIDGTPPELRLRLAALFHDIGKPASFSVDEAGNRHFYNHEEIGYRMTKEIMRRLKFSNDETDAVSDLVRLHMRPLDCGPAGVRRLMRDLGENFEEWKKLKIADVPPTLEPGVFDERYKRFEELVESEKVRLAKSGGSNLMIDGNDLISIGVKPGPVMGRILKALENEIIEDPEKNVRDHLLARAAALMHEGYSSSQKE